MLTGAGRAFCAGADMNALKGLDPSDMKRADNIRPSGMADALRPLPVEPTHPLQTASLATFRGDALTDLLAGLAANSMGSFVKGFTPLRASVASLCTTDILAKPGMTNSPDSFSSL